MEADGRFENNSLGDRSCFNLIFFFQIEQRNNEFSFPERYESIDKYVVIATDS